MVAVDPGVRFGPFHFNRATGELKRLDVRVKLQAQPARVLGILIDRAGSLVIRQELQRAVWGENVVEFDQGLNFCIRQIRIALSDQAESPAFVETVPRVGYRFIARLEEVVQLPEPAPKSPIHIGTSDDLAARRKRRLLAQLAALLVVFIALGSLFAPRTPSPWLAGGALVPRRMLVVLPFENFSPDREQDYFSDGLTEELIAGLSLLNPEQLGVIARTSAWRYKREKKPVDQIRRDLGVDYVMEGSVRTDESRTRITVQLIRADNQTHLWSRTFDRANSHWLQVQAEISRAVADSLALTLLDRRQPATSFASREARDAYLKARHHLGKTGPDATEKALGLFKEAIRLDPTSAPAYAGLAAAQMRQGIPARTVAAQARATLDHALRLDPMLAEAHRLSGQLALKTEMDWSRARREFETALALEPGSAQTTLEYAFYFSNLGRHAEAIAMLKKALAVDPVSPLLLGDLGWIHLRAGDYAAARRHSLDALELEPSDLGARYCLYQTSVQEGRDAEAQAGAVELMRLVGAAANDIDAVGKGGLVAYRRWELEWLLKGGRYVDPAVLAMSYADAGQTEKAMASLERAAAEGSSFLASLRSESRFDPLRSDPRFRALTKRFFPS
jgi:TolB-like protein/DNA-binding winged helix-turn-helix (wHTH) protein/Flp pilus assembly protein TadD